MRIRADYGKQQVVSRAASRHDVHRLAQHPFAQLETGHEVEIEHRRASGLRGAQTLEDALVAIKTHYEE